MARNLCFRGEFSILNWFCLSRSGTAGKGNIIVMGMIELILTVCALSQPTSCEQATLPFVDEGESLMQCAMSSPLTIAQWASQHPGRFVARWRCGYPDKEQHDL